MKACPKCGRKDIDAAVLCRCGADLSHVAGDGTAKSRMSTRKFLLLLGVVCLLPVAGLVLLFWLASFVSRNAATDRHASPTEQAANTRRVVLENHQADDHVRAYIFRSALRKAGERCDSVNDAIAETTGVWRVSCAPGYVYRFRFDSNGEFIQAERVR